MPAPGEVDIPWRFAAEEAWSAPTCIWHGAQGDMDRYGHGPPGRIWLGAVDAALSEEWLVSAEVSS